MTDKEEKDIAYIEAFYRKRLSSEELKQFDARRKTDPDFDEKVSDYLIIMQGITSEGETEFRKKVQDWEAEIAGQQPVKSNSWKTITSIAAAVLIIVLPLSYLIYNYNSVPPTDDLFAAYFEPYPDVLSQRGSTNELTTAMDAYNLKHYAEAMAYFEAYLHENPKNDTIRCYLGIAQLSHEEYKNAEKTLLQANNHAEGLFAEVAEWYLCLTYLKLGKTELLQQTLDGILSSENHIFHAEATNLKSQI